MSNYDDHDAVQASREVAELQAEQDAAKAKVKELQAKLEQLQRERDEEAEPRWSSGGLAQAMGWFRLRSVSDAADAVERLTLAARAIVDSYSLETHCGCGVCCECTLVAAIEAAERWTE